MSILALTSDTLSSPAAAGQIEYSSPIFAATPIGTQRGIVPTQQYYRLDSALAGANVNTAQSLLGVGCTLSSSTVYAFKGFFALSKSAGTTSHFPSMGFGGTATVNNIGYNVASLTSSSFTQIVGLDAFIWIATAAATQIDGGTTNASQFLRFYVEGTVSINAGGTFIPQYTLSAAPGGAYTTQAGSYFLIYPISASGANTNVGTWA